MNCTPNKNPYCKECFEDFCNGECKLNEKITTQLSDGEQPVKLFEYLIKTYTNENDLVLDCCAGSGTTAIACLNTKRNYICIEKDENYFNIMKDRIAKHSVQEVLM